MSMEFVNEKQYVIDSFKINFEKFKFKKLAIYGIGPNTKLILENFPDYNIIGLMDEVSVGDIKFGKPTISSEGAIELGVDLIIIVARINNVPIIYRRIAEICEKNAVPVYDINGTKIEKHDIREENLTEYENISKEKLMYKINHSDVISFDVFDTLVMRKFLYPRDVFRILAKDSDGFFEERVKSEEEFYAKGHNPNIYDIYDKLPKFDLNKEIDLEKDILIKREEVCQMIDYAKSQGKDVFAVSDMYLPKEIIYQIFGNLGICIDKANILVSCDYNASKSNGLFLELRKKVGNKKILHIGDNYHADIISAKKYGIEDTFEIKSALKMLEDSKAADILRYDNSIENRMIIAELISVQLNNPFLFSETNGKFKIDSPYTLSYSFIAPLIYSFFVWMIKKAKEERLDGILLAGRDGYIIEKIYSQLKDKHPQMPICKYFYTSRQAAILSGIETKEDIKFATSLAFAGTAKEMLIKRFMLDEKDILPQEYDNEEYILLHKEAIFNQCMNFRIQYKNYIETLGFSDEAKLGFFDFVSSGTSQKMLNSLFKKALTGLYFAIVVANTDYKPNINMTSIFGRVNVFNHNYKIASNYLYLENIMTSPEPTFIGIDSNGQKIFIQEKRAEAQLKELESIHQGILDYLSKTKIELDIFDRVDIELVDIIEDFVNDKFSVKEYIANENVLEDEFCNRTFVL